MFFFKRKEIVVDCFVNSERLKNSYAPKRASHFIPEWWKKIPNELEEHLHEINKTKTVPTMKFCVGFRDLYSSGFILPMWCDARFFINDVSWHNVYSTNGFRSETHNPAQHNHNFPNYHHVKLVSPWFFKEKSGIKFVFMEPFWSVYKVSENIRIPPAITSFNLQFATNVNMFVKKAEYDFDIKAGEPLVHLIPLTDKKVTFKPQVISEAEYMYILRENIGLSFTRGYDRYKRIMKKEDK